MKLLKWLFHPLYLLVAIIVVAIFVNRDLLFFNGTAPAAGGARAEAAKRPDAPSTKPDLMAVVQASKQPAAPVSAPQSGTSTPGAKEPPREGKAATPPEGEQPIRLWYKARQLAWDNQRTEAVSAYQALIEREPRNFDALGELGNVYLQLGRWEAAAESYHRAAVLLQEAGNSMMAWHLQRIVQGLERERGDRLRDALLHRGEKRQ